MRVVIAAGRIARAQAELAEAGVAQARLVESDEEKAAPVRIVKGDEPKAKPVLALTRRKR